MGLRSSEKMVETKFNFQRFFLNKKPWVSTIIYVHNFSRFDSIFLIKFLVHEATSFQISAAPAELLIFYPAVAWQPPGMGRRSSQKLGATNETEVLYLLFSQKNIT